MNKKLTLIAASLCVGMASASAAQTALRLMLADGSSPTYILNTKPVISFSGDDMLITSDDASASCRRADVVAMTFFDDPATTVPSILDEEDTMRFDGSTVEAAGREITLFSLDGQMKASASSSLSVKGLPAGIYVVRAGKQYLKINIR